MYSNDYGLTQAPDLSSLTAAAAVAIVLLVLIALAIVIFVIVAECKIFTKAGEKWWKALIPLYSTWIQTKINGLAWWWFPIFMGLTALTAKGGHDASYVYSMGLTLVVFNYNYNLAKKFGKSNGFAFLCTILPVIGYPILAFGSAKYEKNAKVDENGIFALEK